MSADYYGAQAGEMADLSAKLASAEITLATLRNWAEQFTASPAGTEHARGFTRAARDVLAILDSRDLPPGVPVHLGE